MSTLTEANRNFMGRPKDEQFFLPDLRKRANEARTNGIQSTHASADVSAHVADDGKIDFMLGDQIARPTAFAMDQILTECGGINGGVINRLEVETAVDVINQLWPSRTLSPRMSLVENGVLRALTSTQYFRIWDAEILTEIDRWLLSHDKDRNWIPAVPTFRSETVGEDYKGKPALWRGEEDSFFFFYGPGGNDGFGGMRKGLFVSNSEVGNARFKWSTFFFRDVCGNFLVWGAEKKKTKSVVHRGDRTPAEIFGEFRRELMTISASITQLEYDHFAIASKTPFVGDGTLTQANLDLAAERLNKGFKVPEKKARRIVEATRWPENPNNTTIWGISNAITSVGREFNYASEMVSMGELAGKVLNLVGV